MPPSGEGKGRRRSQGRSAPSQQPRQISSRDETRRLAYRRGERHTGDPAGSPPTAGRPRTRATAGAKYTARRRGTKNEGGRAERPTELHISQLTPRRACAPRIAAPKEARNPARERAARSPKNHEPTSAADQAKAKNRDASKEGGN